MPALPTSLPARAPAGAAPTSVALQQQQQRRQQQQQRLRQQQGLRLYDEPAPPPRHRAATHGVRSNRSTSRALAHTHAAAPMAPPPSSALLGVNTTTTDVYFTSACVVDSRISYITDTRRFVEYKLAIESPTHGTLFAWHRYSVFLQLAASLQRVDGGSLHDMPRLPSKKIFGNFSDATINERVERLNEFLAVAVGIDFLEWGIRVDDGSCVYKRSGAGSKAVRGSSSGRDSLASNASTATTGSSPRPPTLSRRLSLASFGFRRASTAD